MLVEKLDNIIQKIVEDFDFNSVTQQSVDIASIAVCKKDIEDFIIKFKTRAFNYNFFDAFCGYNQDIFNIDFSNRQLTVGYTSGNPMVFDMQFFGLKHVNLKFYIVFIYNTKCQEYFRESFENNEKYDIKIDEIYAPYVTSNSSPVVLLDMKDVECIPNIHTDVYHITQTIFASYEILEAFYDKMTKLNPNIKLYISDRQAKHSMFCHRGNPKFPEYRKLFKKNFIVVSEGSAKYIKKK